MASDHANDLEDGKIKDSNVSGKFMLSLFITCSFTLVVTTIISPYSICKFLKYSSYMQSPLLQKVRKQGKYSYMRYFKSLIPTFGKYSLIMLTYIRTVMGQK